MPRNRYTLSYDHHPQNPCHHRPSALRRGNNIASAPQEAQDLFNAMCQARCVRKKAMDILGLDSWSTLYRRMRELDSSLIDKGWRTADGICADPS